MAEKQVASDAGAAEKQDRPVDFESVDLHPEGVAPDGEAPEGVAPGGDVGEASEPVEEAASAPPPEITPVALRGELVRLSRTLTYAVGDEGQRLWSLPWIERNSVPVLERLMECILPQDVSEALVLARDALGGVDEMVWTDRLAPVAKAEIHVLAALKACPEAKPPELVARVQLVDPAGAAEIAPEAEESSRGGGRRRRRRRRRDARGEAPRQEEAAVQAPPPPKPRFLLGDPAHTGGSVSELDGMQTEWTESLAASGILTIEDLLLTSPREQAKLSLLEADSELPEPGTPVAICGEVAARWLKISPDCRVQTALLQVGDRQFQCRWDAPMPGLDLSGEVTLAGVLELEGETLTLQNAVPWRSDSRGVVRVVHYGIKGVEEAVFVRLVRQALDRYVPELVDPIPEGTRKMGRVQDLRRSLREMHLPTSGLSVGPTRLLFGELFLQQLAAAVKEKVRLKGMRHTIGHEKVAQLQLQFDLQLGDSQEKAFDEIRRDLRSARSMTRLLQGDVSSGKALVALLSAVVVAEGKSQVLFLAPDALAAEHRALFAEPLLRAIGLVSQLVPDAASTAQVDGIRRGETDIVFATHAMLEAGLPEFKKLGLVVVEERSNFGVVKRDMLQQGKHQPDLLVVTSVPIPSSLAFTLFSDHEISLIDREDEGSVETHVLSPEIREEAYETIREFVSMGRQAYVVFPLRNGTDVLDRERGMLLVSAMSQEAFPGARVALYHGSMSREERYRVFEDFQHRRIDVLLSTTAIEDAPEVPNAAVVMVENADHFDLIRLHRIRGHVSVGAVPGQCFYVVSADPSEEGLAVVSLVAGEEEGFAIAEQDRAMRGDAALLGDHAGDLPPMRWADPTRDRKMLLRARRAAFELLGRDPQLRQRAHRDLALRIFGERPPEPQGSKSGGGRSGGRRRRRRNRGGKR